MSKRNREGDASAKISSMMNTAPDFGEEDDDDLTKPQQIATDEPQTDSGDELNLAQFRKINIELLDATSDKYKGVGVSRRDVEKEKAFGSESSDASDEQLDTGSIDSEPEEDFGESSEQQDEDSDGHESADERDMESEPEDDTEQVNEMCAKVGSDIDKGNAIRNQLSMWDSLLECRIKFQKCLSVANKLPQKKRVAAFTQAGGDNFQNAQNTCKTSVTKLLNSLLELQKVCFDVNTKKFEEKPGKRSVDDDEITSSDSDAEQPEQPKAGFRKDKKRRKTDFSEEIKQLHDSLVPFRNDTIQKWNDKTRVTQMGSKKGFAAFEQSTLKQIETVLADRQRLLTRTRTKRSSYHVLGESDEGPSQAKQMKTDAHQQELCPEIFDDDDFYHQLLRELLERNTSHVTDPVQLTRQWIQLQKARSKMKRPVDQKASKGRKLRYNVHQKLVNFMMPIDNMSWPEEARAELFASLFAKKGVE